MELNPVNMEFEEVFQVIFWSSSYPVLWFDLEKWCQKENQFSMKEWVSNTFKRRECLKYKSRDGKYQL